MGEEAKQAEEKKEEKVEEAKKEEEKKNAEEEPKPAPPPPPPFVLYVDLHCVGCAKKIERSIMKIKGVERVVIDMIKNQITIKGIVEPQAICNKIMKKTKRKAKVLSPLPQSEGEPMPQLVTSQVSEAITVELNVNMHCEACAEQLKKKILKMRGVQKAVTELSTGKVIVTGTMDGEKLVEYVYRRTRKQARIVPQPVPEPKPKPEPEAEKKEEEKAPAEAKKEEEKAPVPTEDQAKKEENNAQNEQEKKKEEEGESSEISINNEEENMKRMMHYYNQHQRLYMIEPIPAPQLFSDENPNACSIS